uniref:Uncharacterized protein n=1 Tax=Rhizophora mucronata TaxID=61149 RepID=A0A2P2NZV3_RHIMU
MTYSMFIHCLLMGLVKLSQLCNVYGYFIVT